MGTFIDGRRLVNSNKEKIQSTECDKVTGVWTHLSINLKHPDCSTGQGSLLGYGGEAHGGKS